MTEAQRIADGRNVKLSKKLHRTLDNVRMETDHPIGVYPGGHWDLAPAQHTKLERLGFVEEFRPHNPVHKVRVIITDKGRETLNND